MKERNDIYIYIEENGTEDEMALWFKQISH